MSISTQPGLDQMDSRPPYPPSWADQLMSAIERLPGPAWISYVAATLIIVLLAIVSDQSFPSTALPVPTAYAAAILFLPLALMHYLDGVARQALQRFKPALPIAEAQLDRLAYELTTMPRGPALIATLLGVILVVPQLLESPEGVMGPPAMPLPLSILGLGGVLFANITFVVLIYHTFRQLRLVSLIHSRAATVNLFQPEPLYAFSSLTMRTGLALILFTYYLIATSPGTSLGPGSIAILGINLTLSILLFALPLYGMHSRLLEEQARLMSVVNGRIDGVLTVLHQALEGLEASRIDALNKGLSSLLMERDLIARAPTWPWPPGTLRVLGGTVLLPIALLILARLVELWLAP